jgi:hypothetical protein
MTSWMFFFLACVVALGGSSALATVNRVLDYKYPYKDPYIATLTMRLMGTKIVKPKIITLNGLPGRDKIRFSDGHQNVPIAVFVQEMPAPLVYVIPGVGGSASEGAAIWLAEFLFTKGFSVISVPSPLHWRFILGQSTTGMPGFTPEDVRDLQRVMSLSRAEAERLFGLRATRIGVVGYSLGAVDAAYLMKSERTMPLLGIERAVLINPPLNLSTAVKKIDELNDIGSRWTPERREAIWGYMYNLGEKAMGRNIQDPYFFYGLDQVIKISTKDVMYLIGSSFRQTLADVLMISEEIAHQGLLKEPATEGERSERLNEALSTSFMDYLSKSAWPFWKKRLGNNWTEAEFVAHGDLASLRDLMGHDKAFYLLHNEDDFLTTKDDLLSLADIMGDRAFIYPLGGHVGGLWHPRTLENINQIFHDLLGQGN